MPARRHPNEFVLKERRENFLRVANRRTKKALDAIALLQPCANRSLYHYTDEDAKKLDQELTAAVAAVRKAFEPRVRIPKKERAPLFD